jgi:hypothetical protein
VDVPPREAPTSRSITTREVGMNKAKNDDGFVHAKASEDGFVHAKAAGDEDDVEGHRMTPRSPSSRGE